MFQQAAESYKHIGQYAKAAQIFEDSKLPLKAFECYEKDEDWESLIECLNRQKDNFRPAERETLISKYVPIALNALYHSMSIDHTKKVDNKYASKDDDIKEEDNEESDSDEEAEENKEHVDSNEKQPSDAEEETIITTKAKQSELESKEKVNMAHPADESFDIISRGELDNNYEHLSNFDPDDEFLRSDQSFSVIGSVMAKDEDAMSQYSEFSIVSGSRASQFVNGNVIQTEQNIIIKDTAMQKIIHYISYFNDDVKKCLASKRSKDTLVQMNTEDETELDFLDLGSVDTSMIKQILDALEHFGLYKLCLIICNKYGMKEQVSRYLTSLCYKYSSKLSEMEVLKIANPNFNEKQRQVSILANEAIHSMLKLVDPRMIEQVKTEDLEENSTLLKPECLRYIYYLGFWKKLIYIMDTHSSLQLCYTMGDFQNFKTVYLLNYRPELADDEIKAILDDPAREWIGKDASGVVWFLAHKVNLETSSQNYNITLLNSSCKCNINANEYLKLKADKNRDEASICMMKVLKHASESLSQLLKHRPKNKQKDHEIDYVINLKLFDIFYFFGRVLDEKLLRQGIREVITNPETRSLAISYILPVYNFLSNLIGNPSSCWKVLSQSEVEVALQAVFAPLRIRAPSISKLSIGTLGYMLMSSTSLLFKSLNHIIPMFKGDKVNHEFIKMYKLRTSQGQRFDFSDKRKFRLEFKKYKAVGASIGPYCNAISAELAPEVRQSFSPNHIPEQLIYVPTELCLHFIKKHMHAFITQVV